MIYRCEICGIECKNKSGLFCHITKSHKHIDKKEYYDKYILGTEKCSFCGLPIPYESKYGDVCSQSCYSHKCNNKKIEDMFRCEICQKPYETQQNINNHVAQSHADYGIEQYYKDFIMKDGDPDGHCLWCGKKLKFVGVTDGYQKFCYNSECNVRWYNKNGNRHKIAGANVSIALKKSRKPTNKIEYWLDKGFSEEEAKLKLSERQRTFTLDKCISKYGEEAGRKRWQERQEKWHKNYKKTNFSKISQRLFWKIYEQIEDKTNIYFAQLYNESLDDSGKNHEYTLKTHTSCCKPDFYIKNKNIIIEFDGSYWHGKKHIVNTNKQRTVDRDEDILLEYPDMRILHVKEDDFVKNEQETVDNCIRFINE